MACLFPSRGPDLPEFQSLLITGPYHSSAPIHLALSHVKQDLTRKAILFIPSRQAAINTIRDEWLNTHAGHGEFCRYSSRIDVLYPPSPAHFTLLMTMMQTFNGTYYHSKTTLETTPSLLIFYELSSYFAHPDHQYTLSSYLSLLSYALQLMHRLSMQSGDLVKIALFDSGLDKLRLPILRPVPSEQLGVTEEQSDPPRRTAELVGPLAEKYFEWVGTVKHVSSDATDTHTIKSLTLRRTVRGSSGTGGDKISWSWIEEAFPGGSIFSWS